MEVLDLLVELGVLERQGDQVGDRLGDGDLLVGELALDTVEEVHQTDDPVACDQRQRDAAAVAAAAHVLAFGLAESRVVEAAHGDRPPRLDGEPVAGPVLQARLLAHPGAVEDAVDRGGQADHALVALESVDVAVGDLQGSAQASRRRLQDLV